MKKEKLDKKQKLEIGPQECIFDLEALSKELVEARESLFRAENPEFSPCATCPYASGNCTDLSNLPISPCHDSSFQENYPPVTSFKKIKNPRESKE